MSYPMARYTLSLSPVLSKQLAKRQSRSESLIMVWAIIISLWDVVATVSIVAMILLSLLWVTLLAYHGLVALTYYWRILMGVVVPFMS